jgi:hypothetical protein
VKFTNASPGAVALQEGFRCLSLTGFSSVSDIGHSGYGSGLERVDLNIAPPVDMDWCPVP